MRMKDAESNSQRNQSPTEDNVNSFIVSLSCVGKQSVVNIGILSKSLGTVEETGTVRPQI